MTAALPDVARQTHQSLHLDQVGMANIPLRLRFQDQDISASATVTVDLSAEQRGIHMSRLYLTLEQLASQQPLDTSCLITLLNSLLETQQPGSQQLRLALRFDWLKKVPALLSDNSGWQRYPIELVAWQNDQGMQLLQRVEVLYSSTCPCSAALSREALAEVFREEFADHQALRPEDVARWLQQHASLATPHSQRSMARVELHSSLQAEQPLQLDTLILQMEKSLATPVQTAVKRTDEQAFALRNGANQMFCEDAARRLALGVEKLPHWQQAHIEVHHYESLHGHDAVAGKWLTRNGQSTAQPRWFR
ncbi:GTP cyclohydrolase FolE2 [Marinospirillum alkaliphilum]|uniref:GTP cyclohydrolase I n=1 Tax=Marinospirillum alkaliphilum DSM 21637 TaxID=1122209 RepID=A0A1K1XHT6_9GAMM|nr:GTP cyclohydrolase FolE2 [Marinospirillum alkaliphilum]SFX49134.1 GTP cyclohydrolase I [Marinospirillum alkaliphilum DSM 21637]